MSLGSVDRVTDAAASAHAPGMRPAWSWRLVPAGLACLAAPAFFVARIPWAGWMLLAAALVAAWLVQRHENPSAAEGEGMRAPSLLRDLSLIAAGMLIVSSIPLKAELDNAAMVRFGVALGGAVVVPYLASRYVYRDRAIRFPWRGGGRWRPWQWAWLVGALIAGWLVLPPYFIGSGVYQNWPVVDTPDLIARLFIGVGVVGIWDELFFICIVFALLRRHVPDWQANLLQAIVFVSFLWELGYQAWGPLLTIPFALMQGFIFTVTRSLAFVVTGHLLFDATVFLVLVHAHNPGVLDGLFPFG